MKVDGYLKAEGGILYTLKRFLGDLLKEGIIDYLLVPQEMSHGRTLTQTLVKDPAQLERANPFSPVMPINSASIVSKLTADEPHKKLGVLLKPCEIGALIELIKLGKANLENLTIIGTDCLGTYEVEDYAGYIDDAEATPEKLEEQILMEMRKSKTESDAGIPIQLRPACRICDTMTPPLADILLSVYGTGEGVIIHLENDLADKLGLEVMDSTGRQDEIAEITDRHTVLRDKVFSEFKGKMESITDFADALATCTRCYACQSACPICYCRVCFLRTETFEPESERYFRWAEKEDVLRMPTEILLYHLTRLNHISASCIGCGLCESACPRDLPLTSIFKTVAHEVQKKLNYHAGRSIEDEIPISTFKETES